MKQIMIFLVMTLVSIASVGQTVKNQLIEKRGDTCIVEVSYYDKTETILQKTDTVTMSFDQYAKKLNQQYQQVFDKEKAQAQREKYEKVKVQREQSNACETLKKANDYIYKSHIIPSIITTALGGASFIAGVVVLTLPDSNPSVGGSLMISGAVGVGVGAWGCVYSKKLKTKNDIELKFFTNGLQLQF